MEWEEVEDGEGWEIEAALEWDQEMVEVGWEWGLGTEGVEWGLMAEEEAAWEEIREEEECHQTEAVR